MLCLENETVFQTNTSCIKESYFVIYWCQFIQVFFQVFYWYYSVAIFSFFIVDIYFYIFSLFFVGIYKRMHFDKLSIVQQILLIMLHSSSVKF